MILLTAIESLREEEKEAREQEDKGSRPGNATLEVTSVETAKAWSDQSERKVSYQWISGLKMLGELILYTKKRMVGATTCDAISEKKVLPAAVLLIGIVYVVVALSLYFS